MKIREGWYGAHCSCIDPVGPLVRLVTTDHHVLLILCLFKLIKGTESEADEFCIYLVITPQPVPSKSRRGPNRHGVRLKVARQPRVWAKESERSNVRIVSHVLRK